MYRQRPGNNPNDIQIVFTNMPDESDENELMSLF